MNVCRVFKSELDQFLNYRAEVETDKEGYIVSQYLFVKNVTKKNRVFYRLEHRGNYRWHENGEKLSGMKLLDFMECCDGSLRIVGVDRYGIGCDFLYDLIKKGIVTDEEMHRDE